MVKPFLESLRGLSPFTPLALPPTTTAVSGESVTGAHQVGQHSSLSGGAAPDWLRGAVGETVSTPYGKGRVEERRESDGVTRIQLEWGGVLFAPAAQPMRAAHAHALSMTSRILSLLPRGADAPSSFFRGHDQVNGVEEGGSEEDEQVGFQL